MILSDSFFSEKTTSHNSNAIMKKKTEGKIILSGAYISVHRSLTEFPAAEIVGWFARNSTGFACFYKVSTAGNQG